jgi:ribosome recycling factor
MLEELFKQTETKMKRAVKTLKDKFKTVRTGRANSAMVENIQADYYGTKTPINQMAKIKIPDPKQIIIEPYEAGSLKDIERAILESELDLTPNSDGEIIRIKIPDLSEERRQELSSVVNDYAEEGKIELRQIRREAREEVDLYEQEGEISEDEAYRAKDEIQEITDKYEEKIDTLTEKKTDEIMTV